MLALYTYWRSSAAYRVRIALNLKGLAYEPRPIHLVNDGGEHLKPAYRDISPQAQLPTLVDGDVVVRQSMAILEYLEETRPTPALLPADVQGRARVRELALAVGTDIHPLGNLRVLKELEASYGADAAAKAAWCRRWIGNGFNGIEALLERGPQGHFCYGDSPTMADCCLVPQYYNAVRWELDLAPYPNIRRVVEACQALEAFQKAAPEAQPDAP
ncbi:maleylacetoacetate isomerase [Luteibacter anthropi]|uniref:Maleylacetoacetate isomerase n=1 Tax=Luteibacter anthropi TaxID=564369 RepID=A0A7X5UDQ0_9GAMM|nr:maleylacetoacetate isomerase [Luteibacter anthropi]NII08566.1 maleylacetoacetate isomerase [Luteibacter anthropi]URX63051.1 maleylacetoacetate isomerase [Luteibacter anthropi]